MKELFDKNGVISKKLPDYETRQEQIRMAEEVEKAVQEENHLIVEAGTGVGKSLAYLIPFAKWASANGKKVVVSTYTKALQTQLYIKDLPLVRDILDIDLQFAMCMGSENYICLRKARIAEKKDLFSGKTVQRQIDRVHKWLSHTESGLRTDMDFVPDNTVWKKFSREPDLCSAKKCGHYFECFYMRARYKQAQANILIVNHSLLFTDIISGGKVLPEFHGMVLDEAHTLEDVATEHFGYKANTNILKYLIEDIIKYLGEDPVWADFPAGENILGEAVRASSELENAYGNFLNNVNAMFNIQEGTVELEEEVPYEEMERALNEMSGALNKLGVLSGEYYEKSGNGDIREYLDVLRGYSERCIKNAGNITFTLGSKKEEYVYWADIKTWKGNRAYSFNAAPINVSSYLKETIFDRIHPTVITSATLSTTGEKGRDFSFIKERLGVTKCGELLLDSPFDYKNNVQIYTPKTSIDPGSGVGKVSISLKDNIIDIYDIMGGRIFVLFTNYEMLNTVFKALSEKRPDINLLRQGDLPRYVLLDVFKRDKSCILLGTNTFWQGVDVPGDSLECVIITKLPFSVPTNPVNASRIKVLREHGENAFIRYQLPQAIIMFKQGFGRLIRRRTDRGVVAVLDPRIYTRDYGKLFIEALPECNYTDNLLDVRNFLEKNTV